MFHDAKPLGKNGLRWLKIHLANLFGLNKISREARESWTNDKIDSIFDSARNPLDGQRWWATAEDPFQALATCFEIVLAMESPNHEEYMCRLPVHQDGSCNGLQHYAALGRDQLGAIAVNLFDSTEPQDVYTKVLDIVLEKVKSDSLIPDTPFDESNLSLNEVLNKKSMISRGRCARLVNGLINRKVIKQTVMTSVYGVTRLGARLQVQSKLEEKLLSTVDPISASFSAIGTPEIDREIFECSR
jgi:DNA-directed RNA polymerase